MPETYSVSQINQLIKSTLTENPTLSDIIVRGEIRDYKVNAISGHHYFGLKDEGGQLRCVMYKGTAGHLRFRPQVGMRVWTFGSINFYVSGGECQLKVERLQPDGIGDLHIAFEELKARLTAQGLFELSHKKSPPEFPKRIALVTSPSGAAVRDMIRILGARWPMAEVYVVPCRVQGAEAPPEIVGAINWVNAHRAADLIITGRGGGSMEDLWCFNDERVARAIYASEIPVISAVGHEPDVTIADCVADRRASTPSNAAEMAVPDQSEQYARLNHLARRMTKTMESRLGEARRTLDRLGKNRMLRDPMTWVDDRRLRLDRYGENMAHGLSRALSVRQQRFARLAASLDALSPLKVLGRGYAIAKGPKGIVKSVKDVSPGDALAIRLPDGNVDCTVNQISKRS